MILVDTSVWIDHLRQPESRLLELLTSRTVATHPLIIEELACGHLRERAVIIDYLQALPPSPVAAHSEILSLISHKTLYGVGLGAVDVHLIASALLVGSFIWSKDKALAREASRLRIGMD